MNYYFYVRCVLIYSIHAVLLNLAVSGFPDKIFGSSVPDGFIKMQPVKKPFVSRDLKFWNTRYKLPSKAAKSNLDASSNFDDPVLWLYASYLKHRTEWLPSDHRRFVEKLSKAIEEYKREFRRDHDLSFYFRKVMLGQKDEYERFMLNRFQNFKSLTHIECSDLNFISEKMADKDWLRLHPEKVKLLFNILKSSKNSLKVKRMLDKFLQNVASGRDFQYEAELTDVFEQHLKLVDSVLKKNSLKQRIVSNLESKGYKIPPRKKFGRKDCRYSRKYHLKHRSFDDPEEFIKFFSKYYRCKDRKKRGNRVVFWQQNEVHARKLFGEDGAFKVQIYQARIYWNQNKLDQAKKKISQILDKNKVAKAEYIDADARYLLLRIMENEDGSSISEADYRNFISDFPSYKHIRTIKNSLIIHLAQQQKWDRVYKVAVRIVREQGLLEPDLRGTAAFSSALFWAGHAAYERGLWAKSIKYWEQAAQDYYLTYYGALSHYFLESKLAIDINAVKIAAEPIELNSILSSLTTANHKRFKRILSLLNLGLKSEASCEIKELEIDRNQPLQVLAQSVLSNAAGQWLAAIKGVQKTPRSFRARLPAGIERLSYPRKFVPTIGKYSRSLKIDPYFVTSLIRQESVFNPRATSSVGAKGLMQLMKRTAQNQTRKIGRRYLSPSKRKSLFKRNAKGRLKLYDPETNIAIGVHYLKTLIERYDNSLVALAAYNAGPSAASRWLKKYNHDDFLVFIEQIPYKETRNYLKLILRNYFYYKKLYSHQPVILGQVRVLERYL